jgi:phenylacetate-CoA ligase
MSWFHTHLLLPFTDPERCAGLPRRLRSIRRFERLPEKTQRNEQQQRLRKLLQHAYDTVPFYREQFDRADFHPFEVSVNRPLPLPILTRDHVRLASTSLLSSAYKPADLRPASASPAIGLPVRFHRNVEAVRNKVALKLTMDMWSGFNMGDSVMMLWGANCGPSREANWKWRMCEGVFMRQNPVPHGPVGHEILDRLRWRYEKQRPKVLYGRSSVLTAFASYLQDHGIRHRPRTVIAVSDVLDRPGRKLLESTFETRPYAYYGTQDVGMIGAECNEHEGMHFHPYGSYVEFDPVGESSQGTVYRLLVTDLLNYAQPFIRYDTENCVTLAPQSCSCGRWFPLVDQVLGRIRNGAVYANGKLAPDVKLYEPRHKVQPIRATEIGPEPRKRKEKSSLNHGPQAAAGKTA